MKDVDEERYYELLKLIDPKCEMSHAQRCLSIAGGNSAKRAITPCGRFMRLCFKINKLLFARP